jgi:AcrR family transcriptional regulator
MQTATAQPRTPLSKERVLRAAIDLADESGIDQLSMRRLARSLGVEAMSLYNHARNKDEILDGIVDAVIAEIELVREAGEWRATMRGQVAVARTVLRRHPWMPQVVETRANPGPAGLRYMDSVVGILREGGFSLDLTHHAMHVLGSRIFGFNQELFDTPSASQDPDITAIAAGEVPAAFPYVSELAAAVSHEGGLGGCDDDVEFTFGLDLILEGLEAMRLAE